MSGYLEVKVEIKEKSRMTIDGRWTNKPPLGYCHFRHHPGCLTENQVKRHHCAAKRCKYLQRFEHEYWQEQETKKKNRKNRRTRK